MEDDECLIGQEQEISEFRISFLVFSFGAFGFECSECNLGSSQGGGILKGMISHTASGVSANLATEQTGKKVRLELDFSGLT